MLRAIKVPNESSLIVLMRAPAKTFLVLHLPIFGPYTYIGICYFGSWKKILLVSRGYIIKYTYFRLNRLPSSNSRMNALEIGFWLKYDDIVSIRIAVLAQARRSCDLSGSNMLAAAM